MMVMPDKGKAPWRGVFSFKSMKNRTSSMISHRLFAHLKWLRFREWYPLYILGIAVLGAVVFFTIAMADLEREIMLANADVGRGKNSQILENTSSMPISAESSHDQQFSTRTFAQDSGDIGSTAKEAKGIESHKINAVNNLNQPMVDEASFSRNGSSSNGDGILEESRDDSMASGANISMGNNLQPKEEVPAVPFFYSLNEREYALLPLSQQLAVVSLQYDYINYHRDWTSASGGDIAEWNDRMREFHLELVRRVGSVAADALTR